MTDLNTRVAEAQGLPVFYKNGPDAKDVPDSPYFVITDFFVEFSGEIAEV